MQDKQYDIFYVLNRLINDTDDSVETVLAQYFLQNYFKARNYNIYDIAAACHVSRSSIRRFAQNLGYQNFQTLKKDMIENDQKPQSIEDRNYRNFLTNTIINIVEELNHRMDTDQVSVICKYIESSNNFYIVTSGASLSAIKDFQVKLSAKGRISKLINGEEKLSYLKSKATNKDCILITSVSGATGVKLKKYFATIPAVKILITADRIDSFDVGYSKVYFMSHFDHSKTPELYRIYGLNYFLDILANHY